MTYVYESNETEVYTPQTSGSPAKIKLVGVAQEVYTTYYQTHGEEGITPMGVVVDRKSWRGQLIFTGQPILLPQESFIPIEQISYTPGEDDEYWE